MTYDEVLTQVLDLLRRDRRVAYRVLKRRFDLDDEYIEDLKADLIKAKHLAADEEGEVLVWLGDGESSTSNTQAPPPVPPSTQPTASDAERRQLTVMFCDLVGSTALSEQLDPEELRELIRGYQETCATVISQYDGHIAQYLGDGLLVYFGYPTAHEDDAARAIRSGLGIVAALAASNSQLSQPLQVRIGIHTGPVVVGEMGGGDRHEQLALGETPNIAARVQGQAEPNCVVISAATARLVSGLFDWQVLGSQTLKGVSTPLELYHVKSESAAQSRFEVAVRTGLTPLVGREHELGVLRERWTQAQAGNGQVVLLSGEPGIGKSRLVQELKDQVTQAGATQVEFRCSPYHRNSSLYPITAHLQRLLQFRPDDTQQTKLAKLQHLLERYRFPQADTLALLAALLSLPHPEGVPSLTTSPQKQKEQTQAALVAWLIEETEQQPVYNSWEDLHWADPSTLEVLDLLLTQVPTRRLLVVLTFRPEFNPPWGTHSYLSHLTLNRLAHTQVSAMVGRVTGGKPLPAEVVEQIVTKTDGVPLFVEELTKMVLESNLVREENSHYELTGPLPPLAIPSTLQDSLMARLDRLGAAKEVAQLGAVIGRDFNYELLNAVSPLDITILQQGLQQLVEVELVFQHDLPPQARYTFKHALIQDTAYESLLKNTRQQYHQQIARVLEKRFTETVETQPELVAHHYTEAGLIEQAIPYWQKAGERATQRSANVEAIRHLTKGIEILPTLPPSPERTQQALALQMALGIPLIQTKGFSAMEVEHAYNQARELCQQLGDTPDLFPVLRGLWAFYLVRADYQTALALGKQLLSLAQRVQDSSFLVEGHQVMGFTLYFCGQLLTAKDHLERVITLYDLEVHRSHVFRFGGGDPGVACLTIAAWAWWGLGYPEQAYKRNDEALALAQKLSHPFSQAFALNGATFLHPYYRQEHVTQEWAEALVALSTEQDFPHWLAHGCILRGWALAEQGQGEEGIAQIHQGLATRQVIGSGLHETHFLALLAEAYGRTSRAEEGLRVIADTLANAQETGERYYEAELYRLKGELTLRTDDQSPESEACFQKAIEIAQRQQAKSWELRAAVSLARLWQQQGKKSEAHDLLAPVYNWFTEGFDTKDLQEATALLEELH